MHSLHTLSIAAMNHVPFLPSRGIWMTDTPTMALLKPKQHGYHVDVVFEVSDTIAVFGIWDHAIGKYGAACSSSPPQRRNPPDERGLNTS